MSTLQSSEGKRRRTGVEVEGAAHDGGRVTRLFAMVSGVRSYTAPVNRAALPLYVLPLIAPAVTLGCNGKISRAECVAMLDRYIDMTVAGEPGLADLPPAEAQAARDSAKALRKSDSRYLRVQEQCEAEITRREFRCAMKAPSPETWQACID
ncbi:MAG: hypothetical protein JWP87_6384 [Labilithrix sp.]|nr:hypothetical protein [Labilithrix sp.]